MLAVSCTVRINIRKASRNSYDDNCDKAKERFHCYYKANCDKPKKTSKAAYRSNPEKAKEASKTAYRSNPKRVIHWHVLLQCVTANLGC